MSLLIPSSDTDYAAAERELVECRFTAEELHNKKLDWRFPTGTKIGGGLGDSMTVETFPDGRLSILIFGRAMADGLLLMNKFYMRQAASDLLKENGSFEGSEADFSAIKAD